MSKPKIKEVESIVKEIFDGFIEVSYGVKDTTTVRSFNAYHLTGKRIVEPTLENIASVVREMLRHDTILIKVII